MGTHRFSVWARSLGANSALLSFAASPALAGPTSLRWMQPPGPTASQFRVYVGPAPDAAGEIVYEGLPARDAQGVYSTDVQIDEIDQRLPVYVWVTSRNAAGESPPSNANFYPAGDPADCDPQLDADCDGIPDDGVAGEIPCASGQALGCDDNCPYAVNPGQDDTGGIGTALRPDGIGDECQCGDVDADGRVTSTDGAIILRSFVVPPTVTMTRTDLCDVGGSLGCSVQDYAIVLKSQSRPPAATIYQQCEPANPLP